MQLVVEWAANWCSLSVEADSEFARLAASLLKEEPKWIKFVRVNLDKAEVKHYPQCLSYDANWFVWNRALHFSRLPWQANIILKEFLSPAGLSYWA